MKKISWKTGLAAGVVAIVGGFAGGNVIAAAADNNDAHLPVPSVTDGKFPAGVAPLQVIGNGKTAGDWNPGTPVKNRPDFLPVVLEDGTHGYVKRTDIDDELVLPELPDGVVGKVDPQALADAARRQKAVMIQPNAEGEVWAPVYAADGVTVIGKKLMDSRTP
ncbi:hypothetical protein ASD11_15160 [Aeromicrobium sp. Root495]|uniref:hypothetical protein n=1 Tax=Aeromicrobium sp. Root495 TaxID=1736550 RepID=UPI0006FA9F6C|nr:hypothetical protein [Aeromicrobium sp. Root495]KQY55837.1 hypothetical protein ASD11_15160 [Aeromicrobium sp. Root495]